MREDAIAGCLVGMAIGDALGLPSEGMTPRRAARLFPDLDRFHFFFGRGMFSDDTEHACMTGQALLVSAGDPTKFIQSLSWRLRWWLLGLPLSVGRATLKAIGRLWIGFPTKKSGVFSAGNGPAMRAPILGVCYGDQPERMRELVLRSTLLTHTDPQAFWGSLIIAQAAHLAATSEKTSSATIHDLIAHLPSEASDFVPLLERVGRSVDAQQTTEAFTEELGLAQGVTGYIKHTVPVVLHAWLRYPKDYRAAVHSVIRCGGDTDTTAAFVGALVGARVGVEGIPVEWRKRMCEWPRDLRWMNRLARELAAMLQDGKPRPQVPVSVIGLVARNFLFNLTVIGHVLRRLLPPY